MVDVFLLIVRLLSFYTILYRSVFVNPSTVRTIVGADIGLQFHHHFVRLTGDLNVKFTVCFIDCSRAIMVGVVRIESSLLYIVAAICGIVCRRYPGRSTQGLPMQRGPS
jgi:hypothetical protein